MSTSVSADYPTSRPPIRTRPTFTGGLGSNSPRTPRTPILGRSISSQFGSPGSFRVEQEDVVIYELSPRFVSAGYAGESRPRCIVPFTPEGSRRAGDYSQYDRGHARRVRKFRQQDQWAEGYELYQLDLHDLDLGLLEDKLDRAIRTIQTDHLQMDSKARKAMLVVPPSTPTPVLEIALRVLFGHFLQPPSVSILASPVLACVSAGLRDALVVDIGWEETVVTAVGEYKEILQRRSIRGGKMLTQEMSATIEKVSSLGGRKMIFSIAEDLVQRVAWCRGRSTAEVPATSPQDEIQIPTPGGEPGERFSVAFDQLAEPAESTFFPIGERLVDHDDHDLPLSLLTHRVLLALPVDFRSVCLKRVILTGHYSKIPGLKQRYLQEIAHLLRNRGWDAVHSYGSAQSTRQAAQGTPSAANSQSGSAADGLAKMKLSSIPEDSTVDDAKLDEQPQDLNSTATATTPAADRLHDDLNDPVTIKAERGRVKTISRTDDDLESEVRGVETLGAWAGASLLASLRIRGLQEIEREDFMKHGYRGVGA